jgi:hypothetical protein
VIRFGFFDSGRALLRGQVNGAIAIGSRQINREGGALSRPCTFGAYRTAVKFDQVSNDGETQTEPSVLSADRAVCLPEAFKDVREEGRIDAGPVVSDSDAQAPVRTVKEIDINGSACRGELDRVRQQIPDDLLKAFGIAFMDSGRCRQTRTKPDLLRVRRGAHCIQRGADHGSEINGS